MTITHRTQHVTSTQRDAWIEINLSALERNFKKVQDKVKTKIMAIVKADAYGHGAAAISPLLQSLGVHSFGVATVDEGIVLRNAGIKTSVLILGATPLWAYETCIENNLTITVYSKEQINQIETLSKKTNLPINIQLKIDTGMNRLGIDYIEASEVIKTINNSPCLKLEGVFSHISTPSDYNFSLIQKKRFDQAIESVANDPKVIKHLAQTHAAFNYPEFNYDLVRIGMGLYGYDYDFLEPLLSLKGRITEIHRVKKGEPVSYNKTWLAEKDSLIATVPIGYADGVSRSLSNKISAFYNEVFVKQIGTITMDQMMFDVTEIPNPQINDVISLIGEEIKLSSWAEILNTLTYELVCRLKIRLPRIYTRN